MAIEPVNTEPDVDLREYVGVTWRRKWLILLVFVLVQIGGFAYLKLAQPRFTSEARLVVEANEAPGGGGDNPLGDLLSVARPDSLPTQLQAMQLSPFLSAAKEQVEKVVKIADPQEDVRIENTEATDIINVRVTSGSPKYSAALANAVAGLHIEQLKKQSLRGIKNAREFAEREAARSGQELATTERRLMLFQKGRRIEDATAEEQERVRTSIDLQSRLREATANLNSSAAETHALRQALEREPETVTQVSEGENPQVQKLRDAIADVEQRRVVALIDYKPASPIVKQLDAQLDDLSRRLEKEPLTRLSRTRIPNSRYSELRARLRESEDQTRRLLATTNNVRGELAARESQPRMELGPWEVRLAALTRQRDQAQKVHSLFMDRLQDLRIREKAHRPGARLLQVAEASSRPSFPNPPRLLLVAAAMGLILGLACALLAERLDDRVHTPEEAERITQVGLLGMVPKVKANPSRLLGRLPAHSPFAEAYRILRSGIAFAALDTPVRSILITSIAHGDGKSLTSVNLATALAMDGKRVILVDADLRRPTLHKLLEVQQKPGLTDVLRGRITPQRAIQRTWSPSMDILTAGSIPSNPSELLNTAAMRDTLETLAADYDTIIVDASPCTVVTDSLVLSTQVDGVLLVVDVGRTPKAALRYARDLFTRARVRVLGLIFNRAGGDGRGYYGRYGYYGPAPDQLDFLPPDEYDEEPVESLNGAITRNESEVAK